MKRLLLAFFFLAGCQAEAGPVEMGTVKRSPDLEKPLAFSKESGKPVLILPQEIPEWSNCRARINTRTRVATRIVETPEKKKRPVPRELKALAKG